MRLINLNAKVNENHINLAKMFGYELEAPIGVPIVFDQKSLEETAEKISKILGEANRAGHAVLIDGVHLGALIYALALRKNLCWPEMVCFEYPKGDSSVPIALRVIPPCSYHRIKK